MSSFIFNEFKKRFLKGEVENNGTKWFFKPVKKDFIENLTGENIKPEQFKDIDSIREYLNNNEENGFANVMCDLYKIEYEYSINQISDMYQLDKKLIFFVTAEIIREAINQMPLLIED